MSVGVPLRNLSAIAPTAPNSPPISKPVSALNFGGEASDQALGRAAAENVDGAHEVNSMAAMRLLARDRQMADPHLERIEYGVGDRRGDRAMGGFAGAERFQIRPRDDFDLHFRHLAEAQNRIVGPGVAGDALLVEANALLQHPAGGLDRAALDLVDDAVRD